MLAQAHGRKEEEAVPCDLPVLRSPPNVPHIISSPLFPLRATDLAVNHFIGQVVLLLVTIGKTSLSIF